MKDYKNVNIPVHLSLSLNQSFNDDGDTYIEFLASNNTTSLTGHRMELSAIEKMKEEALGLPVFLDHQPSRIVGNVTSVKETTPDKFMPRVTLFRETNDPVIDEPVRTLKNWIQNGVQVGASVGASILEMALSEENNKPIVSVRDLKLIEVSLTSVPALQATKGTLSTCKNGLCQEIGSQILNQVYLNNNFTMEDNTMEIKRLAEQIKYKKYNQIEKRQVVKNLNQELERIESKMEGSLGRFKMDEYGAFEEDKKILVGILQALDPTFSIRRGFNTPF